MINIVNGVIILGCDLIRFDSIFKDVLVFVVYLFLMWVIKVFIIFYIEYNGLIYVGREIG